MQFPPHGFVTTSAPFPFDFSELLEPGSLETLSTLEVGVVWRLLRTAWARRGSLPCNERTLAAVAGVSEQAWADLAPRVSWAIGFDGATCRPVAMAIEAIEQRTLATRAVKAAAGKAGAERRWKSQQLRPAMASPPMAGDSNCMAGAKHVLSGAIPEQITPVSSAPTYRAGAQRSALERTDLDMNLERSSAQTAENQTPVGSDAGSVVGRIHAGLDATAAAKLSEWRRSRSVDMLRAAAERWLKAGRLQDRNGRRAASIDLPFIVRIASHPNVRPALVSIAIQRADEISAQASMGYVCRALGATRGGKPLTPYLNDQAVLDHWARLEAAQVDSARAKAALGDVLAKVSTARPSAGGVTPNEHEYAARRGVLAGLKRNGA